MHLFTITVVIYSVFFSEKTWYVLSNKSKILAHYRNLKCVTKKRWVIILNTIVASDFSATTPPLPRSIIPLRIHTVLNSNLFSVTQLHSFLFSTTMVKKAISLSSISNLFPSPEDVGTCLFAIIFTFITLLLLTMLLSGIMFGVNSVELENFRNSTCTVLNAELMEAPRTGWDHDDDCGRNRSYSGSGSRYLWPQTAAWDV